MQVIGICHYNLRAPRELVEALRAFYCDVVGLSVGPRPSFRSFGYWLYAGSKDVLHLTESHPDEHRAVSVRSTLDHVAFSCVDSAAFVARLHSAGVAFESDTVPGTGQLQLFFSDPAGNGVELNFAASGA